MKKYLYSIFFAVMGCSGNESSPFSDSKSARGASSGEPSGQVVKSTDEIPVNPTESANATPAASESEAKAVTPGVLQGPPSEEAPKEAPTTATVNEPASIGGVFLACYYDAKAANPTSCELTSDAKEELEVATSSFFRKDLQAKRVTYKAVAKVIQSPDELSWSLIDKTITPHDIVRGEFNLGPDNTKMNLEAVVMPVGSKAVKKKPLKSRRSPKIRKKECPSLEQGDLGDPKCHK